MSNNWKSVETLEWLKRNGDPIKRLHQDDAHSNLRSNQVGSIQPIHGVVTLELIPVAAKEKSPSAFNHQPSEAVYFQFWVLKFWVLSFNWKVV